MAQERRGKGTSGKGASSERDVRVRLAPTVDLIHQILTDTFCQEVFRDVRTNERERKWVLFALARFWLAVILEPPPSLAALIERTRNRHDPRGFLPEVDAEAEAFYQRCRDLSSVFFMALFNRFVDLALPRAPKQYARELAHLEKKFSDVLIIDGSRLDKIAHRLKILWPEKAAVLPGCLIAVYDLFRGVARQILFDADAASSEFKRAEMAIENLEEGSLLLGDRLYCSVELFRQLNERKCFGLFRRTKAVVPRKVKRLGRHHLQGGGIFEDWLVEVGRGSGVLSLRLIRLREGGKTYEALTNVLEPERLSAQDAVALYPRRWAIERLFYDLKVVLRIEKFYAANPNAVAMQVFAAAIVHTAFRIAQGNLAKKVGLPPEEISSEKLFPYLAIVSIKMLEATYCFYRTCKANPGVELTEPSWDDLPGTVVSLRYLRVQHRSPIRRKREFDAERKKWKSITDVEGSEELT
jgi:Transposase DDE domain